MPIFRDKFGNKNYVFLVLCVLLMIFSTSYIFICASNSLSEILHTNSPLYLYMYVYVYTHCCCCIVAQSCPTLCDPMDCSPPGFSVHGISQARILEWVAISFSRGSS